MMIALMFCEIARDTYDWVFALGEHMLDEDHWDLIVEVMEPFAD